MLPENKVALCNVSISVCYDDVVLDLQFKKTLF